MMFCRTTWARFALLTRKTMSNAVPKRQMSSGLPVSGTNIAFMVLGGGSLTAALYAYKTINSDSARYNDKIAQFKAKTKSEEGAKVAVTAAEVVAETAAVELTTVEAAAEELISGVLAAAGSPAEHSAAAAVEVEVATPTVAEAGTPVAEEPATPVAEDVAADAAVTMGETSSAEEAG